MNEDILAKAGIKYSDGVNRFCGNEELYQHFLKDFCQDTHFMDLKNAIDNKCYTDAFAAAHGLKGACGNLSLDRLYVSINVLTEELRVNPDPEKVVHLFHNAAIDYRNTIDGINEAIVGEGSN